MRVALTLAQEYKAFPRVRMPRSCSAPLLPGSLFFRAAERRAEGVQPRSVSTIPLCDIRQARIYPPPFSGLVRFLFLKAASLLYRSSFEEHRRGSSASLLPRELLNRHLGMAIVLYALLTTSARERRILKRNIQNNAFGSVTRSRGGVGRRLSRSPCGSLFCEHNTYTLPRRFTPAPLRLLPNIQKSNLRYHRFRRLANGRRALRKKTRNLSGCGLARLVLKNQKQAKLC